MVVESRLSFNASIPAIENNIHPGIPRKFAIASITMPHTINNIPTIFLFFILKATYRLAKLTIISKITCKINPPKKRPRIGIPIRLLA